MSRTTHKLHRDECGCEWTEATGYTYPGHLCRACGEEFVARLNVTPGWGAPVGAKSARLVGGQVSRITLEELLE